MRTLLSALAVTLLSAGTLHAQQNGALGVTLRDLSAGGVSIENVIANSPAARIGLLPGDRILSINKQPAASSRDVVRIIGGMQSNASAELLVARGAWQGKLTATLGATVNVFRPNRQFVTVAPVAPAPIYVPASRPVVSAPDGVQEWQFPRNMFDNGRRGIMAAGGGLGY